VYNEPLVEDRERPASEITRKSCLYSCSARTRVTSTVNIRHEQPTGTLRRVVTAWPSYYATFRPCSPTRLSRWRISGVSTLNLGLNLSQTPPICTYIHWSAQSYLRGVQQMAYDHLSIPAMSAECERVFSDTKLTISPNRNRLKEDIIEATECLVQWTRAGW
jgi:hypothetical protein